MIPAFLADRENRKRRGELDEENRVGVMDGYQYDLFMPDDDDLDDVDDDDEEGIVYESKGSSPPPPPDPMAEARAQMALEESRRAAEAARERERLEREARERQERIDKARGLQQQAYQTALGYLDQQIGARGFDQGLVNQYGLLDLYTNALDQVRMGIAEDDLTPMNAYNTRTLFNDAYNTAVGTYRGDLTRQLNQLAPEDFGYTTFADSADDSILQAILDNARSDALAQIDAARARGQLNDVGYQRALAQLDKQKEAAWGDLQDLGLGVLSGYRDQLGSMREDMLGRISNAGFDNPLSFDAFSNRLSQTINDLTGRMQGDIYRATQGQSFFDPSSIISGAGALQGYYNPASAQPRAAGVGAGATSDNPLLMAFTDDAKKQQQTTSAGSGGVF